MPTSTSGQAPFTFAYRKDLRRLPDAALANETKLHGGFAVDARPGFGHVYYGMPGTGILRVSPDLAAQEIIDLPDRLKPLNFHSTKIAEFEGKTRLIMPANLDEMVAILTLEGEIDFILTRPEFEEYQDAEKPFKPTDTAPVGDKLYVADGYGSNYILSADPATRAWTGIFGGKTLDSHEHGRFGTAHGLNRAPSGNLLSIADRLHSRFELYTFDGAYSATFPLPAGSRPCGINFVEHEGRSYAVVGSLDDPDKEQGRPAPIYILDGNNYKLLSTVRPKEELGIELADHIHNVVWHKHDGRLFLVCQAWNPGFYFVLEQV